MMIERGIALAHTTILRWVQRYMPEFEKRCNRYARPVGDSWRADETYIKVRGQWVYLYLAVDKQSRTVNFLLSKRRDMAAAKRQEPPKTPGAGQGGLGSLPAVPDKSLQRASQALGWRSWLLDCGSFWRIFPSLIGQAKRNVSLYSAN